MKVHQHRVSLGALALVACLALPAGLLSLLSETSTGEQVDAAHLVAVGRVASVQLIESPRSAAVELVVDHAVFGAWPAATLNLRLEGGSPVEVGDNVLVVAKLRPTTLLGVYQMRKNRTLLDDEIVTPITGMLAQGISGGDELNPVPLSLFEAAVRLRRGESGLSAAGAPGRFNRGSSGPLAATGVAPDAFESNNTLASATPVTGLYPPTLLTGNPTILTGLTLTPNDVDFFAVDAGLLQVLHAATLEPATGLDAPDTLMGLFDVTSGKLLAHDDDGGNGKLSKLDVLLEKTGHYAVAVESAPDSNLDFDGSEGLTTGSYSLSVELELASFVWNQFDLIMGVSPDGTFIEDFLGFKLIDGRQDLLLAGVPADGWAVDYDVNLLPTGLTHIYGGAGDQLTDPGFTSRLTLQSFELGTLIDAAGWNRRGTAKASAIVGYTDDAPPLGVIVNTAYKMSVGADIVLGDLALQMGTQDAVKDLTYTRVLDFDLFGTGRDAFFWSFKANGKLKAFAVDANTNVGNVVPPAQTLGRADADMQAALVIDHGDSDGTGFNDITHYKFAFTFVKGYTTGDRARDAAVNRLRHAGIHTWVVAADVDPNTGLFAAFGTGLGD